MNIKYTTFVFAVALVFSGCARPFTEEGYINEFTQEVQKYHNDESYFRRGTVYVTHGHTEQALADFNRAIVLSPKRAVLYAARAGALGAKNDWNGMLADLNRSIELDPSVSIVHSTRGALLMRDRKYDDAISDLNLALKLNPKNFHAYENLGILYFKMGEFNKATKNLDKAIALNSEAGAPFYFRGLIYLKSKKKIDGEKYLQSAKDKGFTGDESSIFYGDKLAQISDYFFALGDKGYVSDSK